MIALFPWQKTLKPDAADKAVADYHKAFTRLMKALDTATEGGVKAMDGLAEQTRKAPGDAD